MARDILTLIRKKREFKHKEKRELTWLSHVYKLDDLNNTLLSQGEVLGTAPSVEWWAEYTFERQRT